LAMRAKTILTIAALTVAISAGLAVGLAVTGVGPFHRQQDEAAAAECASVLPQPLTLSGATSHTYTTASGRPLLLHVFATANDSSSHPAIMFFFGGGFRKGHITAFETRARAFADLGYVAILADYRVGCRDNTGVRASLADARSAFAWVKAHSDDLNIDAERIALSGGSAGGYLALATGMLAPLDEKPAALVLFNPVVDLASRANPIVRLAAQRISPSSLSTTDLPPTVVFHGTDDAIVPIGNVRRFCAGAREQQRVCQLNEYQGHHHAFFHIRDVDAEISASPYDDTHAKSVAFLDRHMRRPARSGRSE